MKIDGGVKIVQNLVVYYTALIGILPSRCCYMGVDSYLRVTLSH